MRKNIFSFSLIGTLLVFMGLYIYSQIQLHTPPTEYNFDVQTDDFYIRNLNFVTGHNDTYVSGYHLETKDHSKKFDGVAYVITVDGQRKEITGEVQLDKLKKLVTTSNNSKRYILQVE